jgi:hypothetical protein
MPLTNQKIEQFRRSVQLALNQEWPELAKISQRLASVEPKPINRDAPPNLPVIATVATDGGENRVVLDPIRLLRKYFGSLFNQTSGCNGSSIFSKWSGRY